MRIENVSTARAGAGEGAQPAKGLPAGLKEGDSFSARVVFSENGSVHLKTADGQLFKARVEGDAALLEGMQVRFTVSDIGRGTVVLAVDDEGAVLSPSAPEDGLAANHELAPYINMLSSLRLPVTRQTVGLMQHILKQQPSMPPEKAAFLAASGISGEPAVVQAAMKMLGGQGKMGDMLLELARLVSGEAPPVEQARVGENTAIPFAADYTPQTVQTGAARPLVADVTQNWIALVESILEDLPGESIALPDAPQGAAEAAVERQSAAGQGAQRQGSELQAGQPGTPANAAAVRAAVERESVGADIRNTALPVAQGEAEAETPPAAALAAEAEGGLRPSAPEAGGAATQIADALLPEHQAQALKELPLLAVRLAAMPAVASMGESRVAAFAAMLESAAREIDLILGKPDGHAQGIKKFIDSMFAKIDDREQNTPELIRRAKDELGVKLAFLREAVYRMDSQGRAAPAAQAQRLVDHMRMLSQIDQFTYVQLPIMQNGQQKTAELYIYRDKKGGRRIDPENARILLSLDLEYMGRVQAFVAIRGKEVALRLDVERQPCADFFRSRTADLFSSLMESGYKLTENKVRVAESAVTVETAMQALAGFEGRKTSIDLKV